MPQIDTLPITAATLTNAYGIEGQGIAPTAAEWQAVLNQPEDQAITLINFFKFAEQAHYAEGANDPKALTGQEAFQKYAEVSMPGLAKAGGKFLVTAPYGGTLVADPQQDEDWDLVVVGFYPNRASFLALYADADYIKAFQHRRAALAKQKVLFCTG